MQTLRKTIHGHRMISRSYVYLTTLPPALTALLVQGLASGLSLFAFQSGMRIYSSLPIAILFILQAIFAGVLANFMRQPSWWRMIHIGFPILLFVMLVWSLPAELYAAGFILSVGFYWSVLRGRVPYYPSSQAVHGPLLQCIPETASLRVIDIGSGMGGVMLNLAAERPRSLFYGVEISPIPWLISRCRVAWHRHSLKANVQFDLADYRQYHLADFDVVYAYLSPAVMSEVWQKARDEMRPGTLFVSYEFPVAGHTASQVILTDSAKALYLWRM